MKRHLATHLLTTWIVTLLTTFCLQAKAFEPFRFAVVTDVHINKTHRQPLEDLRLSVQQINATDSIDFVLVTGDIADGGDGQSLQMAHDELARLNKPWYILEGNHDQNWSESGCMDFIRIFGYEHFRFEHKGFLFLGFPTGPMMRMALGHVAPEDTEWVKEQLQRNGRNGKPVFIVCHIPMQPQDVDNWYDITDAIQDYPVVAFISGHYHRNLCFNYDGIPGIVNITNLRQPGNRHGQYNEIQVSADSIRVYTHPYGLPCKKWLSLPMTVKHDTTPAKHFPRPDYSVNTKYPQVHEAWTVSQHAGIYSSPVVWKHHVYAADNLGRVVCYDALGHETWRFSAGARIIGTPAVAKGIVVAGSADGNIYGLDARRGQKVWTVKTAAPCVSAVTIASGTAYVGGGDHTFRAIRVKDGTLLWQNTGIKGYVETRPLVTRGRVVFGDCANTLYCLDQHTGRTLWTWQPPRKTDMHYSPAGVWPVESRGTVYICDPERAMTAIDLRTGRQLWRTYQSKVRESVGLSQDGRRLYAKTMQDSIVCYAARPDRAEELWACNAGFGYEHARVMLTEKDGICFSSTKNGLIIANDGRTGRLLWIHKVGNTLINTVVPLSGHELYFTNEDGTVGRIEVEKTARQAPVSGL